MEGQPLAGRVAVITGGLGDIGRAMALALGRAGAAVVVGDLASEDRAGPALAQLGEKGISVAYVRADVTSEKDCERLIQQALDRFGRLDAVLANAAISRPGDVLHLMPEVFRQHLEVNVVGAFLTAQAGARALVRQGEGGTILFTGSWVQDVPQAGIVPYCTAKSAVKMLARGMALELAPYRITVNVVAPGIVDAGLSAQMMREDPKIRERSLAKIPLGELQQPESVAEAALYLCSPAGRYITGATLLVDGGLSLYRYPE